MMQSPVKGRSKLPMAVLMGLRGSGKSTIAAHLAQALARRTGRAVDLDDVTAAMLKVPHAGDAARALGWEKFRAGEFLALQDCLAKPYTVLALGGGTPTHPPSQELLEQHTRAGKIKLVYLHASPEVLQTRLAMTDLASRPSLTGQGVLEEITQIYAQRDGLYRKLASTDMIIEADRPVAEVVQLIVEAITPSPA